MARTVRNFLLWVAVLLYMELVLHFWLFDELNWTFLYNVGFSAAIAMVIACLLGFLPQRANKVASIVLVSLLSILFCTQIVYEAVFGTMYSVSQISLGGAALTNFWKETLVTTVTCIPILLVMLLPIPAVAFLTRSKHLFCQKRSWQNHAYTNVERSVRRRDQHRKRR